ncbi:MAG: glycosyltransferase family A protein [Candidatus Hodarchaeota archaeon]
MIELSVITSYYNRPEALEKFLNQPFFKWETTNPVEFIIEKWDGKEIFSTSICHNRAVRKAKGKWILKQDIDCTCSFIQYLRILEELKDKPYTFFMNIGCENYLCDLGFPQGNLYVCSKQAYQEVGGEPEWSGYGWEDYVILYKLAKLADPKLKLNYNETNVTKIIRDQIARKLNKEFKHFSFYHWPHPYDNLSYTALTEENRKKCYLICKELDK